MNKFFTRLKRVPGRLGGAAESSVEIPYKIDCDCGETVKGIRRASWIEAECPSCAAAVFVLPQNVYPSTRSVPSEVLGGPFRERLAVVTRELFLGSEEEQEQRAEKKRAGKSVQPDGEKKHTVGKGSRKRSLPRLSLPKIDVRGIIAQAFSPFRLIMMAVIATVGLTAWYMIHQRQIEDSQKLWLQATTEIKASLDKGDTVGLTDRLEDAVEAGTILQKRGSELRWFSNLLKESKATDKLAPSGLVDVFQSVYDSNHHLVKEAADQVDSACSKGWFLFDVVAQETSSSRSMWQVDFPATPGLHPVTIELPAGSTSMFPTSPGGLRIVFVAQLKMTENPSSNEDGFWVLTAEPSSFALVTHPAYSSAAGFRLEDDETLGELIQKQRSWIEEFQR